MSTSPPVPTPPTVPVFRSRGFKLFYGVPLTITWHWNTLEFCPDVGPDPYKYWQRFPDYELLIRYERANPILGDEDFLIAQLRWNAIPYDNEGGRPPLPTGRMQREVGMRKIF